MHTPRSRSKAARVKPSSPITNKPVVVRIGFANANAAAASLAEHPLRGKTNYLIGRDPSKWRTNIDTYGAVRQRGV